mmetsp:Transcript_9555/g.14250  ORF Transcript_9555/g.14250 Transcript_9555/m.14250 type:complete len:210 (+) Transcript_9555:939-1568(+)
MMDPSDAATLSSTVVESSLSFVWSEQRQGDALCILAACLYATYDLRLFAYGKRVDPLNLIQTKIATQAILSTITAMVWFGYTTTTMTMNDDLHSSSSSPMETLTHSISTISITSPSALLLIGATLWSGLIVNAFASLLQVTGQQVVGPARAQVVYASQPLWAAMLSFAFLGEAVGYEGLLGGCLFLIAMFLAATAEEPDADCGVKECEV